jgi:hypothetical protein
MASEFDWIAVRLTSTQNPSRVGGFVVVSLRFGDQLENVEIPFLFEDADNLTIAEVRTSALKQAVERLRGMLEDLDGQSWEDLGARQERQDKARAERQDKEFAEALSARPRK